MSTTSTPKTSDNSPFNKCLKNNTEGENLLIIKSISTLLEEIIIKNKRKKIKNIQDSFYIPSLSLCECVTLIVKNTKISMPTLILSIVSITKW